MKNKILTMFLDRTCLYMYLSYVSDSFIIFLFLCLTKFTVIFYRWTFTLCFQVAAAWFGFCAVVSNEFFYFWDQINPEPVLCICLCCESSEAAYSRATVEFRK